MLVASLVTLTSAAAGQAAALTYATTWDDGSGTKGSITFDGTAKRGVLAGTIQVNELSLQVKGTIAVGRSITGNVARADGKQLATFTGRVENDGVLRGSVTYGSTTKAWSAPASVLPSATAP